MHKELIKLIRPKQWVKNIFVLVPLIFSRTFLDPEAGFKAFAALLCFIAASSAVYILNDLTDLEKDRHHEKKRLRPLAAGTVSKSTAVVFMVVLAALGLIPAFFLHPYVFLCLLAYMLLNVLYSNGLRRIAIVDIMIIASGFVLRVIAGAAAIPVYISSWVLLCTFFLALCLAAGKRKSEKAALNENPDRHRKVLSRYTEEFLKQLIQISVTGSAITYALYTVLEYERQLPMVTILFVFFGLFRYLQLILEEEEGRLPEEIVLSDKPLLLSIVLFGAAWIAIFLIMK